MLYLERLPKTLTITNDFRKAKLFTDRNEADAVAMQFNGTVVAPKGGLVPAKPVKADE